MRRRNVVTSTAMAVSEAANQTSSLRERNLARITHLRRHDSAAWIDSHDAHARRHVKDVVCAQVDLALGGSAFRLGQVLVRYEDVLPAAADAQAPARANACEIGTAAELRAGHHLAIGNSGSDRAVDVWLGGNAP